MGRKFSDELVVTVALLVLMVTSFAFGAGSYGAGTGLVRLRGYLGLVIATLAGYLACAEVCEAADGRSNCRYGRSPSTEFE